MTMILGGKARKDFREYFETNEDYLGIGDFYNSPFSMQFGVYVDFFDSKGIIIEIQIGVEPVMEGVNFRHYRPELLYENKYYNVKCNFGKRHTANKAAIEKANEIYNNI